MSTPPATTESALPIPPVPGSSASDRDRWFLAEVHPHDSSLRAYVRSSFPGVREWEDVIQESYLRIWRARAAVPIECARAFLFRVARRVALDVVRKHRNAPFERSNTSILPERASDDACVPVQVSALEKARLLGLALSALPPRCREVIVLCKYEGRSHLEIAEKLGISPSTVNEHVQQGMARLAVELQKRGLDGYAGP